MIPIDEIIEYIKAEDRENAIYLARKSMKLSYREAKSYVESLELEINAKYPVPKFSTSSLSLSAIDEMDGHDFEYYCADLLKKIGFSDVSVTPGSGDQGVDILATKDGIKYAIQCKNYSNALSNTPVQEVAAGKQYYNCHVGVVLTNSTFTQGAIKLAGATNVLLWDRNKLEELILLSRSEKELEIEYDNDNEDINNGINTEFDNSYRYINEEDTTIQQQRKGMRIWSKICYVWSIICFFVSVVSFFIDKYTMKMVLGEGLFVLVLGSMFKIFSLYPKGSTHITLLGLPIPNTLFAVICIIIAYIPFLISVISISV